MPNDATPLLAQIGWGTPILVGLVVFAGLLLLVLHLLGRWATRRWESYAEALRARGSPLTYDEVDASRGSVPEGRNGARVIEKLGPQLDELSEFACNESNVDGVQIFNRAEYLEGEIPRETVQPSRKFLGKYDSLLRELEELRNMPAGRVELEFHPNPFNGLDFPPYDFFWTAGPLVELDSLLKAIDGNLEGAAESTRVLLRLAGTLDDLPCRMAGLFRRRMNCAAVRTVESILSVGALEGPVLATLSEEFEICRRATTAKWAFLGERAAIVRACEEAVAGRVLLSAAEDGRARLQLMAAKLAPRALLRVNQLNGAALWTELVDACDAPQALREAAARVDMRLERWRPSNYIVRGMYQASRERQVFWHLVNCTLLDCARVGLATERFRHRTGRLAESITELVPDFLDSVPNDPFDGKPLRYAVTEHAAMIHSDQKDRRWTAAGRKLRRGGDSRPDIGFWLPKPEHRGSIVRD